MTVTTAQANRPLRPWMQYLSGERPRLIRLCARLTGSYDVAEDLAQETLFEAWRQADNLRDESVWRAFVNGIARNVCLRWRRRQGVELARRGSMASSVLLSTSDAFVVDTEIEPADTVDIMAEYERRELAVLIDRALIHLPDAARSLLIERYIEDIPPAEMAARRGMTENALGVRVFRAKEQLQRLLNTEAFRADALSFGLLSPEDVEGWTQTRLWCPRCGNEHLVGRFTTTAGEAQFALRCPACDHALGQDFTSRHAALRTEQVLGDIKGFKPALNRLSVWWHNYFVEGRAKGRAACPFCGKAASLVTTAPIGADPRLAQLGGLFIVCSHCSQLSCMTASGMAFHTPQVQQFWRDHPRLQLQEETPISFGTEDAVLVVFRSLTDSAVLEAALSATTFETLSIQVAHSSQG